MTDNFTHTGIARVRTTQELRQAMAAGYGPDKIVMEHPITDADVERARNLGFIEGKATLGAEIAKAVGVERMRISELQALREQGVSDEMIRTYIDSGLTLVGAVQLILDASQTLGAAPLELARGNITC